MNKDEIHALSEALAKIREEEKIIMEDLHSGKIKYDKTIRDKIIQLADDRKKLLKIVF